MHNVWKLKEGSYHTFETDNFQSRWISHPDPDIDLCVMPISYLLTEEREMGHALFYQSFGVQLIPTQEQYLDLTALEDVVMIGYPNGIGTL
ncbi:hypothetical protein [Alicyclobacillus sp. ALC3]|uniref:hypothetical protein n=1 Tax=Alicyclobacillus sp. ALC3 TaxID=2796143 RepID=UPI002379143E|nr:hypothetical protein [Alicyclobacillus sp. ALC3]WDL97887.1 hypothetical protein JC200_03995 [Alicyclobacillus sp. ALC3]